MIRIPDDEYKLYKELAAEKGESLAEFFRKAARKRAGIRKKKYSIWDLGTKIIAKGGPRDGSVNADKYYYEYEDKKRRFR
ncbi:hypothetical protein HY407_02755 [Candidatus Gottesmanbacteria bacterium]|nr:hypothetical protein [Candidatus Gottesmanbacteria bacterium]